MEKKAQNRRFPSVERLKSEKAIEHLFNIGRNKGIHRNSEGCLCYPLRAVWTHAFPRHDTFRGTKILVSVPKKKIRHAVDRVLLRRRVREAWRLNRPLQTPLADMAFIYVGNSVADYDKINAAVKKIITKLTAQSIEPEY